MTKADAELRRDFHTLPHAERLAVGAIFQALANAWGAHPAREREILAALFDTLALTDADRAHIEALVGTGTDPAPFASRIRDPGVRAGLLREMLALAVAGGSYDARDREGLRRLAAALDVEWTTVVDAENRFAAQLRLPPDEPTTPAAPAAAPAVTEQDDFLRSCLRGLSEVAAAGAGMLLLGTGAAVAGAIDPDDDPIEVTRSFGAAGRALLADKLAAFDAEPSEFAFDHLGGDGTHVVVAVPGWLSQTADGAEKWGPLSDVLAGGARYSLRWESKDLIALRDWLYAIAAKTARTDTAGPATEPGAQWPVAATAPFDLIDNPWHVAARRAEQTGRALAARLRARRDFGGRPVSLIGFSLGARVIFRALEDLARTQDYGLIHQAIFMGGAFTADRRGWEQARRAASGRVANAFCTTDWVLAVAYRAAEFKTHAAGLGPAGVAGIEDIDVTTLAGGHLGYDAALPAILRRIQIEP